VAFTDEIRRVKRAMWVKGEEQFENDSEHSYQLAMISLYIIKNDQLDLDVYHAMALALVHDVLEVHSGDTPVYGSRSSLATKAQREADAVIQLKRDWPKLTLLHELIEECEDKKTPESKFIYALDKLVPMLNNYLDGGRNWQRQKVSLQDVITVKTGKVDIDPTIEGYYRQTIELLRTRPDIFGC